MTPTVKHDECSITGCDRPAFYRIATATTEDGKSTGIWLCYLHSEQYAESLKPEKPEPVQ